MSELSTEISPFEHFSLPSLLTAFFISLRQNCCPDSPHIPTFFKFSLTKKCRIDAVSNGTEWNWNAVTPGSNVSRAHKKRPFQISEPLSKWTGMASLTLQSIRISWEDPLGQIENENNDPDSREISWIAKNSWKSPEGLLPDPRKKRSQPKLPPITKALHLCPFSKRRVMGRP